MKQKAIAWMLTLPDAKEYGPKDLNFRLQNVSVDEIRECAKKAKVKRISVILDMLERNHRDDPNERARIAGFESPEAYEGWRNYIQELLKSMGRKKA